MSARLWCVSTMEQRLPTTGSATPVTHVNAGRLRTLRTSAKEDDIITRAAMERKPRGSSYVISRDRGYLNRGSSTCSMTISSIHTTTNGAHIFFSRQCFSRDAVVGIATTSTHCRRARFKQHSAER